MSEEQTPIVVSTPQEVEREDRPPDRYDTTGTPCWNDEEE